MFPMFAPLRRLHNGFPFGTYGQREGANISPKSLRSLEKAAGACSLGAGALHAIVAPAHLDEWWGYGLFFLGAAAAQILFGLALLTDAINTKDFGVGAALARRWLLVGGILGNVAILVLYIVTRTVGIPWFGPEAGEVESVGIIDVLAGILEIAVVALVVLVLWRGRKEPIPTPVS